jgi:chitin-binding protein
MSPRRPTAKRTLARSAAVVASLLSAGAIQLIGVTPAQAHGAPDNPVSRVYACSPEGSQSARSSAACTAAIALSAQGLVAWDNLRVANINGRDRQLIPDGKLCSGGLAAYRGLDLPRADWPATKVTAGASFRFTYRTTIQHPGTFRMYVTNDSYRPTQPLTWSDVESTPFLTAANPPVTGGAYRMSGRLPTGRTGRQIILTIWQTNPDTYYSCSDAIFGAPAAAPSKTADAAAGGVDGGSAPAQPPLPTLSPTDGVAPAGPIRSAVAVVPVSSSASPRVPITVGGLVALAIAAMGGVLLWRRRRT